MNKLRSTLLLIIALFSLCPGTGHAETIISTSFATDEQRINMIGKDDSESPYAPDGVAPSGAVFQLAGGGSCDTWMREGAALMHNGGAVAITLAGKNTDAILTISAEISFDQYRPEEEAPEGKEPMSGEDIEKIKTCIKGGVATLGFYSEVQKKEFGNRYNSFAGLQVGYDGNVQLYANGVASGDPIAYVGTFDPAAPSVLSFSVNTVTGALVKASFGTSTAKYEFSTTAFTKEATAFAGFGGSLGNYLYNANFRKFEVTSEPAVSTPP